MTPDAYVNLAKRTDVTNYDIQKIRITEAIESMHGLMGITTECGELMDIYKAYIMYGKPIDIPHVLEEIGDILWYIALVCHANNLSLEEAMAVNIAKLKLRYPEKFTEEAALNRDLNAERNLLEGK